MKTRPPAGPQDSPSALREADAAASVAHDFVFGLNGVTKEEASDAIWRVHHALRPLIAGDLRSWDQATPEETRDARIQELGEDVQHLKDCVETALRYSDTGREAADILNEEWAK